MYKPVRLSGDKKIDTEAFNFINFSIKPLGILTAFQRIEKRTCFPLYTLFRYKCQQLVDSIASLLMHSWIFQQICKLNIEKIWSTALKSFPIFIQGPVLSEQLINVGICDIWRIILSFRTNTGLLNASFPFWQVLNSPANHLTLLLELKCLNSDKCKIFQLLTRVCLRKVVLNQNSFKIFCFFQEYTYDQLRSWQIWYST